MTRRTVEVKVSLDRSIQQSAEDTARAIRELLAARKILAINLISSPGSGKTTLIEKAIEAFGGKRRIAVVEGDIETDIDTQRIRKHGVQVCQINTRSSCHIQPAQLVKALEGMDLDAVDILIVENVGNLVCPAEVPLGEDVRVVLLSVTEGDEKPLKYPLVFKTSNILVITKTDLLPFVQFDPEAVRRAARAVNPGIEIFEGSATRGDGLDPLFARIESLRAEKAG
jgi:hydrogenase nickel incorporation protein HypB